MCRFIKNCRRFGYFFTNEREPVYLIEHVMFHIIHRFLIKLWLDPSRTPKQASHAFQKFFDKSALTYIQAACRDSAKVSKSPTHNSSNSNLVSKRNSFGPRGQRSDSFLLFRGDELKSTEIMDAEHLCENCSFSIDCCWKLASAATVLLLLLVVGVGV